MSTIFTPSGPDKFINPFTDFGFKRLFGSEDYKELLIDFLNTLLPERHQIKELNYRKNEHIGNSAIDRKAIFDLYCESSSGEKFIVEVQRAKQKYFKDRSIFYSSFPIQEQAQVGEWNFKLSPVYFICFLDFIFDESNKNSKKYLHEVTLIEKSTHEVFSDRLNFIFLELPKFKKKEEELETHFEKWLYAFKHLSNLYDRPVRLQELVFKRFFEAASIARFSSDERTAYEDSLKVYRDLKNSLDTAIEEGWAKGHAEGHQAGHAAGHAAGRTEGGVEMAKNIARNLLLTGMDRARVAQITQLSVEDLLALEQELK
jgi:predicted transposase/invertase (TIGR01784 family)